MTNSNGVRPDEGLPLEDRTQPVAANDTRKQQHAAPASGASRAEAPPLIATRDLLAGLLDDLAVRHQARQDNKWTGGLRCGLPLIDTNLRGLRPKAITMLAAEPKIGKTTLTNQIAYQTAAFEGQNTAALYVSFELDPADLLLKHLSRLSGWKQNDLLDGAVSPNDKNLQAAAERLACVPLFYLRAGMGTTPTGIIERAKEAKQSGELLLVIDYLQYFARFAAGKGQYEQISQTLPALRQIADETGAALLVIVSQNRETNKDGKATQFGGRGSGEIEYDCDTLLSLTKDQRLAATGAAPCRLTVVNARYGGADTWMDLEFYRERAYFGVPGERDVR